MLNIRPAISDDWPLWRALDGHISQELFLRKAGAGECCIALEDDAPAGLLRWNLFWDSVPFCTLLMVEESRRGSGVGRALVNRWEADMAARGHGMVMTSTQVDETAQHFWRKLGYRDAGGFTVDVPGYAQPLELVMIKGLRGEA